MHHKFRTNRKNSTGRTARPGLLVGAPSGPARRQQGRRVVPVDDGHARGGRPCLPPASPVALPRRPRRQDRSDGRCARFFHGEPDHGASYKRRTGRRRAGGQSPIRVHRCGRREERRGVPQWRQRVLLERCPRIVVCQRTTCAPRDGERWRHGRRDNARGSPTSG